MLRLQLFLPLILLSLSSLSARAQERPNIVFLLADDQCVYSMGCYGTPGVQTPQLDRLASDGLVFDNHYDTTAICMASRASIMTGMYEYKTGCNFEHGPLLIDHWQRSYPVLLRDAGYQTAFAGKFGFEVAQRPAGKGVLPEHDFDRWGGGPGQTSYQTKKNPSMAKYAEAYPHSTRSYGAFGRDFVLDAAKSKQPFCLSISFKAPHHPTTPDPAFDEVYRDKHFTKPANFGREYGEHFSLQSRTGRQYERFHSWHYDNDYDRVMATYYQQIHAIDVAVGMIRDAIEEAGVEDNTVIIYTSDNGFLCGSHGYASKVLPYEEASRVPLIVFDPRHKVLQPKVLQPKVLQPKVSQPKDVASNDRATPRRCDALTGNVDIAPTILKLAGIAAPENMDGRDLMTLYESADGTIHESLPLINVWGPASAHSLGVVTKNWKYIHWPYEDDTMKPCEELYDTEKDPLELTNLSTVNSAAGDLIRMRSLYDQAVMQWKAQSVPYHDYQQHGDVFTRQ